MQFRYLSDPAAFEAALSQLPGMTLAREGRYTFLQFTAPVDKPHLRELLALLAAYQLAFSLYDPLYPSPSDPGAYLSYFPLEHVPGWRMTLGNHGWTGGVYTIRDEVIVNQLFNLIRQGQLQHLKLGDIVAFTHYSDKPEEQNEKQNQRLSDIHLS